MKSYIKAENICSMDNCQKQTIKFLNEKYSDIELLTLLSNEAYNPIQIIAHDNQSKRELVFLACKHHESPYFLCSVEENLPIKKIIDKTKHYIYMLNMEDVINEGFTR